MNLPSAATQTLLAFRHATAWETRARLLIQYGAQLEPLSPEQCSEEHRVLGCESQVWLIGAQQNGHWQFQASSDARLLRGLIAVLLVRVNGLSSAELASVDLLDWFNQLGLARQLSPSRSNGLQAVLQRMQRLTGDAD
jgi:cysteine desulfuration protein SufE